MKRTIQFWILTFVLIPVILMFVLPCIFFSFLVMPNFRDIEEKSIIESTSRIGTSMENLSAGLLDLGKMLSKDAAVIALATGESNAPEDDIGKFKVDYLVIVDRSGRVVYEHSTLPKQLDFMVCREPRVGVIQAGQNPMLGCLVPIAGDTGCLILGQKLTVARLGIKEECRISVFPEESVDGHKIIRALDKSGESFLAVGNSNYIVESVVMNQLTGSGTEKLIVQAEFERKFKSAMKHQFMLMMAFLSLVTVLAILVMLYSLRRIIIVPLHSLAKDIDRAARDSEITIDRKVYSIEFASMIDMLNGMFSLSRSRDDELKEGAASIRDSVIPKLYAVRLWLEGNGQGTTEKERIRTSGLIGYIEQSMEQLAHMIKYW